VTLYSLVGSVGFYVDELATLFAGGEYYYSIDECEECVVLAHAYVKSGVVYCATLALDDVACLAL